MLQGLSVLIVEDDAVIASTFSQQITDSAGRVIGPFSTVGAARDAIRSETAIGAAVLDVVLGREEELVTPVLEALRARNVPVIVCSGGELPEDVARRHPEVRFLSKPVLPARLIAELVRLSRGAQTGAVGT